MVNIPNWHETDQLASNKCGRGVELGAIEKLAVKDLLPWLTMKQLIC